MIFNSTFFLFVFMATLTMKAFFRTLAAAFRQESGAQAVAGLFTIGIVLYTGYAIPRPSMIGALKWLTFINVRTLSSFLIAEESMY